MATVTVESRIVAGGRLQTAIEPVTLAFLEEEISVADLIRRTVEEQVRVLKARARLAEAGDNEARALLARQYGETMASNGSSVDAPREVERAQQAFREGRYLILLNGSPATNLKQTLTFAPGTTVRFVRLTPLVGG